MKRAKTRRDAISDLPDHIKQHILSLLDIKEAIRTSVLSRRWRHQWNWLPRLTFKRHHLSNVLRTCDTYNELDKRWKRVIFQEREAFVDFLERTLIRRRNNSSSCAVLQKLHLFLAFPCLNLASRIDQWLFNAMSCDLEKLTLHVSDGIMRSHEYNNRYCLSELVLAASTLTSLKLFNCTIISKDPNLIALSSLQKMSLFSVYVEKDTLNRVIAGCPKIRKLSVIYCVGLEKLEICKAPDLEEVQVSGIQGINVTACKKIQRLILEEVALTSDQLTLHLHHLLLLEHLHLLSCCSLKQFEISSQSLRHLVVQCCHRLVEAEIDASNLDSFTCSSRRRLALSLNAPTLKSVVVNLSYNRTDFLWYHWLIKFLQKFNHVVNLTLLSTPDMGALIPKELRQSSQPPLFNVKHVRVEVECLRNHHSLADAVDFIFWLSPHPDSITITVSSSFNKVQFHFIYKEADGSEASHSCCYLIPTICWRHCLKEVKIDGLTDAEYSADLKAFFEKAEKLERIEGLPL